MPSLHSAAPVHPRAAHPSGFPASRAVRAGGPLWAPLRLLLLWQTRAGQRTHLAELDERLLADMGLTRAQARAEAAKPFWRA